MALYKYNTSGVFSEIKEKPFKLERDIQRMFETNMSEIMGLEMIKSEFTIKDRRIDTLAFDLQSKAFVIIEYKRERNSSVIDQGFTYCCRTASTPQLLKPVREINDSSSTNLKIRGEGFPDWLSGVTVPTSRKPKPKSANSSKASAFLSNPADSPIRFLNCKCPYENGSETLL